VKIEKLFKTTLVAVSNTATARLCEHNQ